MIVFVVLYQLGAEWFRIILTIRVIPLSGNEMACITSPFMPGAYEFVDVTDAICLLHCIPTCPCAQSWYFLVYYPPITSYSVWPDILVASWAMEYGVATFLLFELKLEIIRWQMYLRLCGAYRMLLKWGHDHVSCAVLMTDMWTNGTVICKT